MKATPGPNQKILPRIEITNTKSAYIALRGTKFKGEGQYLFLYAEGGVPGSHCQRAVAEADTIVSGL